MRIFGLGPLECLMLLAPLLIAVIVISIVNRSGSQQAAVVSARPAVPAGWFADPSGRHELRYWDGGIWTAHVSDHGAQSQDPISESSVPG